MTCCPQNIFGPSQTLQGSCGLEYSLARVPQSFTPFGDVPPNRPRPGFGVIKNLRMYSSTESCLNYHSNPNLSVSDPAALLFYAALIYFGYLLFKSCVMAHRQANGRARRGPGGGRGNNGGWSSWFGGGSNASDRDPPPPYYPKQSPGQSSNSAQEGSWTPGFWTGLGLGGLAASLWSSRDDATAARRARERAEMLRQQEYDWERAHAASSSSWFGGSSPVGRSWSSRSDESDRAGPSSLGETRRSTAIGSSRVR